MKISLSSGMPYRFSCILFGEVFLLIGVFNFLVNVPNLHICTRNNLQGLIDQVWKFRPQKIAEVQARDGVYSS